MSLKSIARIRRCKRSRKKIASLSIHRLSVFRSTKNIYAQIISVDNSRIVVSTSSLDKKIRASKTRGDNINGATEVGKMIAAMAKAKGIERVAFDSSGYKYHGRVKALADAAREGGLQF